MSESKYKIGDLVRMKDYESRIFQIEAYVISENHSNEGQWKDITYDLTDINTGEYALAFQEDLTLITSAEDASEYLSKHKPAEKYTLSEDTFFDHISVFLTFSKANDDAKRDEKTNEQIIDELLDEYNDIKRIVNEFGDDVENNYNRKLIEIEQKIKKMSSEGGR